MTRIGSFLILAGCCLSRILIAADGPDERESLRDLDGVRVVIEDLRPGLKAVSAEQLKQLVEAKLRQAGIPVLTSGDFPVGDPHLRVRVATSEESSGMIGYDVDLGFYQVVFMRRNPTVTFNRSRTWKAAGQVGLARTTRLAARVRQELSSQLDQFISAYLAVNPK